jgi:solute carrier family 45 protein 1/2/4
VQSSDPISGLFIQPIFGALSDKCKSPFGRRRPYIALGSFGVLFFLVFIILTEKIGDAAPSDISLNVKRSVFIIALTGYNCSLNLMQNPSRTIIQDLVPVSQRVKGNFIGSLMVALGIAIMNLIGGINLSKLADSSLDNTSVVLIVGGILFFVSFMATIVFAKEEQLTRDIHTGNVVVESFNAICHMPKPVWRAGMALFLSIMSYVPFQVACTDYFGHDIYEGENPSDEYNAGVAFGMIVLSVSYFVVVIVSFFADRLVEKIGVKWTYVVCEFCDVFALTSVLYLSNRWGLLATLSISAIPFGVAISLPYTITALSVPPEQAGVYLGALNIFTETSGQVGLSLFQSGIGSQFTKRYPTIACGGFCAIFAMASSYFLIVPKELSEPATCKAEMYVDPIAWG